LSLGSQLESLHDHLADSAERPLLEDALVSLYSERLQKLGYDATPGHYSAEPAEQQLLRRELIGVVGLTGRSAEVRSALSSAADRSAQNPNAVEPLLRWRIWAIGLQERGAPLFAALKKLATDSPDAQVRTDAATALGYTRAADSSDALDTSLDSRLEVGPAVRIVFRQMANPSTRDAAWKWLSAHRDAALARVPGMFQSYYARVGSAFCSTEGRQSFNTVLGERLRSTSGGEVQVDRALEGIDDCVALRAAVGDSIRRTLQKQ
jgi:alanyl aminopeptidase